MPSKSTGYIRLSRDFFSSWIWDNAEYTKAWLDLLSLGQYRTTDKLIRGKLIKVGVGELVASRRFLAKRWNWSERKTRTFLDKLEMTQCLTHKTTQSESLITIVKYGVFRFSDPQNDPVNDPQNDQVETQWRPKIEERKKSKEINKGGELCPPCSIFNFLSDEFSTDEFCKAWDNWLTYRKQRNLSSYKAMGLKTLATSKLIKWGVANSIISINESIANNYQGLFEVKQSGNQTQSNRLSLEDFRICYKWQNAGSFESDYPDPYDIKIVRADMASLQANYKHEYNDIVAELAKPYSKMKQYLMKIKNK